MQRKKVMIVDDEESLTKMLKLTLEQTNRYEVCAENKPLRALATAWEFAPDVVILDVLMPGMEGTELAKLFKTDRRLKHVPILFLTATVTRDEASEAWQENIIYMRKPTPLPELINGIEQALELAKVQQSERGDWVAGSE
jgi:DNA-binding response OmpR family regulator